MNSGQKAIKISAICLAIFIIISIVNGIFFGLSILGGFGSSRGNVDFTETYQNVSRIKLDIGASKLTIVQGETLTVEANGVSNRFTSKVNNNILRIEEHQNWFWNHHAGEITITVPQNVVLEELDIDCGAGKISIDSITARKLDLEAGAGLLEINNSNFAITDIDGGAGEISITSSILRNLDLDAGVGKVSIDGEIYGKSEIDCGVGEVNLNLGDASYYQFNIQKGIGSIRVNDTNYQSDTTLGSGENTLKIDGGIGSIQIQTRS